MPNVLQGIMQIDLNHYWNRAGAMPEGWTPEFYHCGPYNQSMDSFPVMRSHHHIIYIPASSKPIFRFLQHAMYAMWYLSHCERLSEATKRNMCRASGYLHFLREAFFDEVRAEFYPSHPVHYESQELPTCDKMTRQWFSSVLFSWGQAIYHTNKMTPPGPSWSPPQSQNVQSVSTEFGEPLNFCFPPLWMGAHRLGTLVNITRNRSYPSIAVRFYAW